MLASLMLTRSLPFALLLAALALGFGATTPRPIDAGEAASIQGDVNCSQAVDSVDSLQVLRATAGLSTNAECLADAGDVDCDEDADSTDALRILRHVAALAVSPVEGCTPIGEPLVDVLPPTSEELIASALTAGDITYEQSLLERAYAIYADPRQDPRFVSPIIDWEAASALLAEIDDREAELSAGLLDALAPFRARPNDPVSIVNNPPAGRRVAPQGLAWRSAPAPGTNARAWAFTTADDDMASYINAVTAAWSAMGPSPGEAALFRYPRPDQEHHPNEEINPDDRIDFYFISRRDIDSRSERCAMDPQADVCTLQRLSARGVALRAPERIGYTSSAYLMVDEFLSGDDLIYVTAHELAHASQFSYDNQEDPWLQESTAVWVGYKVIKRLQRHPGTPYDAARALYRILDKRMTMNTDQNNYGSWLFFYFASMEYGDGIVTSVWEQAALPNFDGIKAVDNVISMNDNFGDFAVRNWNLPPVDPLYDSEDDTFPISLRPAVTKKEPAPPGTYDLGEPLPPLSAQYYEFRFTPEVRKVTVTNFVKDIPTAHIWAMQVIDGVYEPPEDWSRVSEKTFCRDLPEEDLSALIVIISNGDIATHDNPLPVTPHVEVDAKAAGCQGWKGTATSARSRTTQGSLIVTSSADLFWEYHDFDPATESYYEYCELDPDPCLVYTPRGDIDWHVSHVHPTIPPCVEEHSGTIPAGNIIIRSDQELVLRPDGTGGYFYSGTGLDPTFFLDLACGIGGDVSGLNYFQAPEFENFHVSPDGRTISGSWMHVTGGKGGPVITFESDWDLHYLGDPP